MVDDLFSTASQEYEFDQEKNYLDELVGEGKKFADPNKLAYGKLESDRFINRLQSENDAMRKELTASKRLESLVDKLAQQPNQQSANNDNNQDNRPRDTSSVPAADKGGLTPEQAETLFVTKLAERENFQKSHAALQKVYGSDYQQKLDAEAKRLGLAAEDVNRLAKVNPELFIKAFASNVQTSDTELLTPPRSSINPSSLSSQRGVRNEAYYKDLKAKEPTKYWSREVQIQEYQDAMKQGTSFFE